MENAEGIVNHEKRASRSPHRTSRHRSPGRAQKGSSGGNLRTSGERRITKNEKQQQQQQQQQQTERRTVIMPTPCAKCDQNCTKSQHALRCECCEQWLHKACIEGMTEEYYDNVVKTKDLFGASAFLCKTCCKVINKVKAGQRELEGRVKALEVENGDMKKKMAEMERRVGQFEGGLKTVESGLTKAKEEVREEVQVDMREREERAENLVIFGLKESQKGEAKERVKEDEDRVKELWECLEIEMEEDEAEVKFRAGKKKEDGKPRPLIVKVKEAEKKERVLSAARKLAKKDSWKGVFLAPDLTPKQREEDKKKEEGRKREAEDKTVEARREGRKGKYIVVGQRGRRRIVWKEEEGQE